MANPEHVAIVKQGAAAISEWRSRNPEDTLDLTYADLSDASLSRARLAGAYLYWTNLARADLSQADLSGVGLGFAILGNTDLSGANLTNANLFEATLPFTNLVGANLSQADLSYTKLQMAFLEKANFSKATLNSTSINDCDLSHCLKLDTIRHESSSSIGIDTLIASFRGAGNKLSPKLTTFFRGAGVPDEILKALPNIVGQITHYTCFICYGEPDLAFAEKLRSDLVARGVSCWLYAMNSTPWQRTWKEIQQKRREDDSSVLSQDIGARRRFEGNRRADRRGTG